MAAPLCRHASARLLPPQGRRLRGDSGERRQPHPRPHAVHRRRSGRRKTSQGRPPAQDGHPDAAEHLADQYRQEAHSGRCRRRHPFRAERRPAAAKPRRGRRQPQRHRRRRHHPPASRSHPRRHGQRRQHAVSERDAPRPENDHAFWTSAEIRGKAPEEFRGFFDLAVNAIKPYAAAGKLSLYKDGTEFAPGVRRSPATATPSATAWCGCRRQAATSSSSATSCIARRCNFPIRTRGVAFDTDPRWRWPTARKSSTWWRPTSCCSPAATCRFRDSAMRPKPAAAMRLCR